MRKMTKLVGLAWAGSPEPRCMSRAVLLWRSRSERRTIWAYHRLNFELDPTVWTVPAVFHPAHENGL